MLNDLRIPNTSAAASTLAAAVLAAFSVSAQAGIVSLGGSVAAGNTAPTNILQADGISPAPPYDKSDGMIFFAVFEKSGANASDPWGTGYDVVSAAVRGQKSDGNAAPVLDTTAKYLYVYQAYNSQNHSPVGNPGVTTPISQISIGGDLPAMSSWGALQKTAAGGSLGTYIEFAPVGNCQPEASPTNPSTPAKLCAAGTGVAIKSKSGISAVANYMAGTYDTSINGYSTGTNPHLLKTTVLSKDGFEVSTVKKPATGDLLAEFVDAFPLGGTGPLFGDVFGTDACGVACTLHYDAQQFSTVFYYTSDLPPGLAQGGIIGSGTANGQILSNVPVPEPAMLGLLGGGLLLLSWSRRMRKS